MTLLTDYELDAWKEYESLLDKYDESHKVRSYDRVSIHNNFPEIMTAFEHCLAMRTYRLLEGKNE